MPKPTWDRVFALPQFWIAWHFGAAMTDDDGNDYPPPVYPRPKLLKLPLPRDYTLTIDFADDAGVAVRHPRLKQPVFLGFRWGCFKFPILRWQEVMLLERRLRQRWRGDFSLKYLPLLLDGLAAFTAGDKLPALSRRYWADWRRADVISDDDLVIHTCVGKTINPVEGLEWRYDARIGWVAEGAVECLRAGYRTEEPDDEDVAYFQEVRKFFRAVQAGWQ